MRWTYRTQAWAVLLVLAARVGGEEEKVATKVVKDRGGKITLAVPADWKVEPDSAKDVLGAWDIRTGKDIEVRFVVLDRKRSKARVTVYADRPSLRHQLHAEEAVIKLDGVPRIEALLRDGRAVSAFFVERKGRVFRIESYFSSQDGEHLRGALMSVARSLETTLPPYPPEPPGYGTAARTGFRFFYDPKVKKSVAAVAKLAKKIEKSLSRRHGAFTRDRTSPPTVILCPSKPDARALHPRAGELGYSFVVDENRVYGIAPAGTVTPESQSDLAAPMTHLLLGHKYPAPIWRYWFGNGEATISWVEARVGKPLPAVHSAYYTTLRDSVMSLSKLRKLFDDHRIEAEQVEGQGGYRTAFVYVAFFHKGPKKYRAAYAAFLKELAATGDAETAERKHLGALDEEELRQAVEKFLHKKLKSVELE